MKMTDLSILHKMDLGKKHERITAHLQYAGFRAPQVVLWLMEVQCSESIRQLSDGENR